MSVGGEEPRARGISATPLTLSGVLLLVGFVVNGIQRMIWHRAERKTTTRRSSASTRPVTPWGGDSFAEFVLVPCCLGRIAQCSAGPCDQRRRTSRC